MNSFELEVCNELVEALLDGVGAAVVGGLGSVVALRGEGGVKVGGRRVV